MNGYNGGLAYTGAGALTVGGLVIDQVTLVGIAFALVLTGAVLVRVSFRRGKTPSEI
jgi:hypothetical protein